LFRLLPRKTSLRMRVMVCCAALGGVVGVCLAFVAERISEHYEHMLISEEMAAELDAQIIHHGRNPDEPLPRTPWKSLYIDRPGLPPTSPIALRSLPPGVHELDDDDSDRFAGVRESPIGRVTMVAGLPNSPARERRFAEELLAMILLGIVLAAWLGRMLASSMLAPVLRLSDQVDRADPTTELRGIAEDHRSDEVGALATAFIRYHGRMQAAIEREVLFSADASHELRTPLSVLQGALDLLRDGQASNLPGRRRVERIRRSAAEIGMLLDALLLIARPDETQDETEVPVELGAALASVIAEFNDELEASGIVIGVRCPSSACVVAPPELLRVALRLLFRAIASGVWGERLRLDADAHGLVLSSADPGVVAADVASAIVAAGKEGLADAPSPSTTKVQAIRAPTDRFNPVATRRSDETGGIGMLRRLCEHYGWKLECVDVPDQPFLLRLLIPVPARISTGAPME
jgi:signal transduction histidine kinase